MHTLLFLGDSITDCNHNFEPDNLGVGYVRRISEKINAPDSSYQVLNKGNDGFTISALSRLWNRSCQNLQPDFITILIGINDLAVMKNTGKTVSVALAEFRDRYQSLITDIRKTTACPILLMEPFIFPHPAEYASWEADLRTMSNIVEKIALDYRLSYLSLQDMLSDAAKKHGFSAITTDGIHLTPKGHALLADRWLQFFQLP